MINCSDRDKNWDFETEGTADLLEKASESIKRSLVSSLSINDTQLFRQIEGALKNIGNGTYGSCESCGNPIPERRLKVLPYATHCVSCQEALEKQNFR